MEIGKAIIEEIMNIKNAKLIKSDINDETDLIKDLGFNSMEFIQLIVAIEDRYEFSFEEEYMNYEIISKFKKLKDYVSSRVE